MPALLQSSIPRSGNHLLLKLLWDAIPGGSLSACEFYTAPDCCKQIPCLNIKPQVYGHSSSTPFSDNDKLFVHKTHDFQLSDLPTSGYATIFQYRDPLEYLFSHLIWEVMSMRDFSIGSTISFVHNHAIYYIRMHLKWAVLYSDLLAIPPVAYESLLTAAGKSTVLRGLLEALGFRLTNEQLQYALDRSSIHSHLGSSFTSSVVRQSDSIIADSLVRSHCITAAANILKLLPHLSALYSIPSSQLPVDYHQLLPSFSASADPDDQGFDHCSIALSGERIIKDGSLYGRPLYLEGTGIGCLRSDGSHLQGNITLLQFILPTKAPISSVDVVLKSPETRIHDNYSLLQESSFRVALIYVDRILGWFEEPDDLGDMHCSVTLQQPIIPSSNNLLLALGFRPERDLVSICDELRVFRIVSEITLRVGHR